MPVWDVMIDTVQASVLFLAAILVLCVALFALSLALGPALSRRSNTSINIYNSTVDSITNSLKHAIVSVDNGTHLCGRKGRTLSDGGWARSKGAV
jgi:hypothetical protein